MINSITKPRSSAQSRIMIAGTIFLLSAVAMLRFASPANAGPIVACSTLSTVTSSGSCTVAPGESIQITLKGGNGGFGGVGGTGGAGGAGLTGGSSSVSGGLGGVGGLGGLAGQGAKLSGTYTNNQSFEVTLTYTVGVNGFNGAPGNMGINGLAAPSAGTNGSNGQAGGNGAAGAPGTDSSVADGYGFTLTAGAGGGADGGTGGGGGVAGHGDGTVGNFGAAGIDGATGTSGESVSLFPHLFNFLSSTPFETPAITFAAPTSETTTTVPLATTGSTPTYLAGVALVLLVFGASMMLAYRRFER